jgi:serine/threonine-protein kinase
MSANRSQFNPLRVALAAYGLAVAVLLWSLRAGGRDLPARVATHFDGTGRANGWGSARELELLLGATGVLVPAFVVLITYLARYFPSQFLNVPNPEYWRAPANRPVALAFMFRLGVWWGAALTLWFAAFNASIVRANLSRPPHLGTAGWVIPTVLLVGLLVPWFVAIRRFFARVPPEGGDG